MVDHRNPATTLDNRRPNIRVCTNALNQQNTGSRGGASTLTGASWYAEKGRWKVAFRFNGRFYFVGYFHDEGVAARALRCGDPPSHKRVCAAQLPSRCSGRCQNAVSSGMLGAWSTSGFLTKSLTSGILTNSRQASVDANRGMAYSSGALER